MTFEEYMSSDEGKAALAETKQGMKHISGVALFFSVLCIVIGCAVAVFDILDDLFAENRAVRIASLCVLGAGALFFAAAFLLLLRYRRQIVRFNGLLCRAVALYYAENPVPWESFAANGELLVSVDNIFPDGYGAPREKTLLSLVLTGGEGSCTLDMRLFRGAMDLMVTGFLAVSLFPFLERRAQMGETFRSVRLAELINGKLCDDKKEGYLIKKGKLTREGKALKKTAAAFSRT